jgi:hypothetical protein
MFEVKKRSSITIFASLLENNTSVQLTDWRLTRRRSGAAASYAASETTQCPEVG